jgi:hypothetical protein
MNNKDSFFQYAGKFVITLLTLALLISLFGIFHLIRELQYPEQLFSQNLSYLGQFLSGSAGALISLAGIIVLIKTFRIQFKIISTQKDQIEEDKRRNKRMSFDNTFFELLKVYNNIVSNLRYEIHKSKNPNSRNPELLFEMTSDYLLGKEVIEKLYKNFNNKSEFFMVAENKPIEVAINLYYKSFNKYTATIFQYYYRTLYYMFNLINNQKDYLTFKEREFYANIVRAQFTPEEILFLFYNCISYLGKEYFKPIVEEYGLLRNIDVDNLIDIERNCQIELYDKKAYGGTYPTI